MVSLLAGPDGTHLAAPARRLWSAQQGALMLRDGRRRFAVGCEAGDWAHVDAYLTKSTDYRLLAFAGSG
ncbi:MAG: iron dicitrate transport regulator FecR [Nocardioides sp.]|nr:iron dicitrate transport regulator FecR [Nocardioides sp.]